MDTTQFWQLIANARDQAGPDADHDEIAATASDLLAARPPADIVAAEQVFWDLMSKSYGSPLWAAAYMINGGCSDDGFDYFRGWLILQGQDAFDRAVADPDSLADLPVVREAAEHGMELEGEGALSIASSAYQQAAGEEISSDYTINYSDTDDSWDFDFDDTEELKRRLPKLAELYR
ncbi:DUF4240 domain-containing protein [Kibdelosporangium philippinense]|uniref:DUF4240 domain-containing protein n=1 Tax=Kibdelosporangium philippinense TaxID=211113 RepID=A0ABS8Z7K8_9PSEU|nr:DUF4240 domain-containing protein [Kibdelosporangium philippinense]MCE7003467.1 DUF4240 domain-containing protein [Kibdelosporangium philippinense]